MATEQKSTETPERLREKLEAAKEVEQRLLQELVDMPTRMHAAATQSAEGFREATESGQELGEGPALSEARRRAEELPTLVWSASLSRMGVQIEYHEARAAAAKREQYRASEKVDKLEKKRFELQEEIDDLMDTVFAESNDARDRSGLGKRLRRERAAAEDRGPDFDLLKRRDGSLRQRP